MDESTQGSGGLEEGFAVTVWLRWGGMAGNDSRIYIPISGLGVGIWKW